MSHFAFYYCDLDLSNLDTIMATKKKALEPRHISGWSDEQGLNSSKPKGLMGWISHSNIIYREGLDLTLLMNRLVALYQNTGAIGRTTSLVLMENR